MKALAGYVQVIYSDGHLRTFRFIGDPSNLGSTSAYSGETFEKCVLRIEVQYVVLGSEKSSNEHIAKGLHMVH